MKGFIEWFMGVVVTTETFRMLLGFGHNIFQHVIGYYVAVLLADWTKAWARRKFYKEKIIAEIPFHIVRVADQDSVKSEFGKDFGFDVLTVSTIKEMCEITIPILLESLKEWAQAGKTLVQIPAEHRALVFDRIVSRVSEALTSCPIEGRFLLFMVNEELAPNKAVRIIGIELSTLQRFTAAKLKERPITSEREDQYHKVATLTYLAEQILDADGELPFVKHENGDLMRRLDRELYAIASDANKGCRRAVSIHLPKENIVPLMEAA